MMTYINLDGSGLKVDKVASGRSKGGPLVEGCGSQVAQAAVGLGFDIGLPNCTQSFLLSPNFSS